MKVPRVIGQGSPQDVRIWIMAFVSAVGLGVVSPITVRAAETVTMEYGGFCDNGNTYNCQITSPANMKAFVGVPFDAGGIYGTCWHGHNVWTHNVTWAKCQSWSPGSLVVNTGTLPPGLFVNGTNIKGVPERAGDWYLTITIGPFTCDGLTPDDGHGRYHTQTLHIVTQGSSVPRVIP